MVGRMEKVALREVWKKEAKDFNKWLFDNIEVLGEELSIDLTAVEKEKSIGSFWQGKNTFEKRDRELNAIRSCWG